MCLFKKKKYYLITYSFTLTPRVMETDMIKAHNKAKALYQFYKKNYFPLTVYKIEELKEE